MTKPHLLFCLSLGALVACGSSAKSGADGGGIDAGAGDGGSDGGADGGGTSAAADQACGDLAQARCEKLMACTNGFGVTRAWGTLATCLVREKLTCNLALAAPATGNSPALVEQCVATFPSYTCANFLNDNPPTVCRALGSRPADAACSFAEQCASGYCNNNKTSVCGTCRAEPVSGDCVTSVCGRNQVCFEANAVAHCMTLGAVGETCGFCGADLSCAVVSGVKTCEPTSATPGMACDVSGPLPGCDAERGLWCIGPQGSRTCTAQDDAGDGMPCGYVVDTKVFIGCRGGGGCYTSMGHAYGGTAGTCKAPAADGAACDIVVGPPCQAPARCVVPAGATAGVCTIPMGTTCN